MNPSDYLQFDALGLAQGIASGDFSVAEVSRAAIQRAEALNPRLNAIVAESYLQALDLAQHLDSSADPGGASLLAGVPFLIKDLAPLKGLPISHGSRLYDGVIADRNSNIVRRYLDAGLLMLGKTNTPEFGLTLTTEPVALGPTHNPWQLDYSTGGSSGGAAAAVAAGIVPAAHATDGGGSIRIPAACCGLVGLKPSRGLTRIENYRSECWSGMSVGHVVSRSVRDSAAFLDLIALQEAQLFPMPPRPASFLESLGEPARPLKIGLQLQHPFGQPIDDSVLEGLRVAGELCQSLGHAVEELDHPLNYRPLAVAMNSIVATHIYQSVTARLEEAGLSLDDAPLERSTRNLARAGAQVGAYDYIHARDLLTEASRQMAEFHRHCDVIVSPVLPLPPAKLGWLDMNMEDQAEYGRRYVAYSGYTAIYNGTGQPSLSLPLHRSPENLPIGIQFTADWGQDALLLQLARQLEQAAPWPLIAQISAA